MSGICMYITDVVVSAGSVITCMSLSYIRVNRSCSILQAISSSKFDVTQLSDVLNHRFLDVMINGSGT